jgi:hypothetical protein
MIVPGPPQWDTFDQDRRERAAKVGADRVALVSEGASQDTLGAFDRGAQDREQALRRAETRALKEAEQIWDRLPPSEKRCVGPRTCRPAPKPPPPRDDALFASARADTLRHREQTLQREANAKAWLAAQGKDQ